MKKDFQEKSKHTTSVHDSLACPIDKKKRGGAQVIGSSPREEWCPERVLFYPLSYAWWDAPMSSKTGLMDISGQKKASSKPGDSSSLCSDIVFVSQILVLVMFLVESHEGHPFVYSPHSIISPAVLL